MLLAQTKNATEFLSMIQKFLAGAQQAVTAGEFSQQALNDLAGALKGSSEETRTAKTELDRLTESLKFQAETAGMTEQQIAEFVVRQLAAKDSTIDLDAALKQVSGYYERIKAAETLTQKTKEQEQELNRAKNRMGKPIRLHSQAISHSPRRSCCQSVPD